MVQTRKAGLLLPPKKKHKNFPTVVHGKIQGTVWGTRLHVHGGQICMVAPSTTNKVGQIEGSSPTTHDYMAPTVSTLESDPNSMIQETNARREKDAETTKRELSKIEACVADNLIGIAGRLADNDKGLMLLH